MFALDFLQPVAERIEKILVGGNDRPAPARSLRLNYCAIATSLKSDEFSAIF